MAITIPMNPHEDDASSNKLEKDYLLKERNEMKAVQLEDAKGKELRKPSYNDNDVPLSMKNEFLKQLEISLPVIMGMLLSRLPWLISLHVVGGLNPGSQLGSDQLASTALAQTLANVTGMSIGVGLSTALSTLAGQAHGSAMHEYQKVLSDDDNDGKNAQFGSNEKRNENIYVAVYLIRGLFVMFLFIFPISLYWLFGVKPLLLSLGQSETVSEMTEGYLRVLVPGLLGYSVNWTITAWLQAIGCAEIPSYFSIIMAIFHYPFNYLFIYTMDFGFIGAAWATSASQLFSPILMIIYLFGTKIGRERLPISTQFQMPVTTVIKSSIYSITGIHQYLKLAFPGIVIISEWWASEIAVFLAGTLRPDSSYALDGITLYQAMNTFCFMFPVACTVAGSARTGNFLGAGDAKSARVSSTVSVVSAGCLSLILGSVLLIVPHNFFPSIFDPDPNVVRETASTIPYLSLYVFADGVQYALNGIIKGCGRQPIVMPIVIISYWLIGLPLAYNFAFIQNDGITACDGKQLCGIVGLVSGMTIGTYCHFLLLLAAVLFLINFDTEVSNARARLALENEKEVDIPDTTDSSCELEYV